MQMLWWVSFLLFKNKATLHLLGDYVPQNPCFTRIKALSAYFNAPHMYVVSYIKLKCWADKEMKQIAY